MPEPTVRRFGSAAPGATAAAGANVAKLILAPMIISKKSRSRCPFPAAISHTARESPKHNMAPRLMERRIPTADMFTSTQASSRFYHFSPVWARYNDTSVPRAKILPVTLASL